jgi:hypothetical protein
MNDSNTVYCKDRNQNKSNSTSCISDLWHQIALIRLIVSRKKKKNKESPNKTYDLSKAVKWWPFFSVDNYVLLLRAFSLIWVMSPASLCSSTLQSLLARDGFLLPFKWKGSMPAQQSHLQDKVMGSRVSASAWQCDVITTRGLLAGGQRTSSRCHSYAARIWWMPTN